MSNKFWFKKVRLHRTPGFAAGEFPPLEELSEGLNVVWGPNGVGKSSLSRSMSALLWDRSEKKEIEAEGTLESFEGPWRLSLSQGQLHQVRLSDNQRTSLPGRVDELCDSYWFPLHGLLQAGETGAAFVKQVKKEMQGGVDVQAAAFGLLGGKHDWILPTNKATRDFKEADRNLKEIVVRQDGQKDIQQRIADLQSDVDSIELLKTEKAELEQAKGLLELREKIEDLELSLSSFPPQISQVEETSPQRLQELRSLLNGKEQGLEDALIELKRLKGQYEKCGISKEQFDDTALLEKLQESVSVWKEAKKQLDKSITTLDEKTSSLQAWEEQHAWIIDTVPGKQNLKAKVEKMKKLSSQCEPLRCAVVAEKNYLSSLGPLEEEFEHDSKLSSLSVRLQDWMKGFMDLHATPEGTLIPKNLKMRVVLAAVVGTLLMVLLSFLHPLATVAGSVALVFVLLTIVPKATLNEEKGEKAKVLSELQSQIETEMESLGGYSIAQWSAASALELQTQLEMQLKENQALKARNQVRKVSGSKFEEAKKALSDWKANWKAACEDLNLSTENPTLSGAEFFNFSEHLTKWVFLVEGKAVALSEVERNETLYEKTRKSLQQMLHTSQEAISDLSGLADNLKNRIQRAHELQEYLDLQLVRIEALETETEKQRKANEKFWENLDIAFDDEKTLEELAKAVPEWREQRQEQAILKKQEVVVLEKNPKVEEIAQSTSFERIVSQIEARATRLAELDSKKEELGSLKNQYAHLLDGSELAQAMLAKQRATEHLEALRHQELFANVVGLLADKLSQQDQMACQPQVLVKASTWMQRITQGRYTLSVNDEGFFAHDTIQSGNFKLEELSSGTRVQLLFAVRMAFIESQELSNGFRFPIFLDELLANSDDNRAMEIALAIKEIANDRQVFYFTAQRDEVEKLKSLNVVNFREIPLEDLKRGYTLDKTPRPAFTFSPIEVPAFEADYNLYGEQCKVPGPTLFEPIGKLHSWYIETTSERLGKLLSGGLNCIGQVYTVLGSKDPVLKHRYELLQKAQELAREGRCRVLDVSDLEAEDLALNRKAQYWQQIEDLVREEKLDGNALLQAIEQGKIKRFNEDSRQILYEWLCNHQFATDETPYGKEAILDRLFASDPLFTLISEDRLIVERYLTGVIG
jgi:uncharacterized protein YhaN